MQTHNEGTVTFPAAYQTSFRYQIEHDSERIRLWFQNQTTFEEWYRPCDVSADGVGAYDI